MGKPNYLPLERALNCQNAQSIALIILQQKVLKDKSHTTSRFIPGFPVLWFTCLGFMCLNMKFVLSILTIYYFTDHSVAASIKPVFNIITSLSTVNLVLPRSMET